MSLFKAAALWAAVLGCYFLASAMEYNDLMNGAL